MLADVGLVLELVKHSLTARGVEGPGAAAPDGTSAVAVAGCDGGREKNDYHRVYHLAARRPQSRASPGPIGLLFPIPCQTIERLSYKGSAPPPLSS